MDTHEAAGDSRVGLDEVWRRDLPRTRRDFSRCYRLREAIFAAGCHLCDQREHDEFGPLQAIVGSLKASAPGPVR